jgi:glucose/mannose-6-phosphate isomerase
MNLDDHQQFQSLDPENMLAHIQGLPDQLQSAWELGLHLPLPQMNEITRVVIVGMGGSAIGADLLAAYLLDRLEVPVIIHRDYGLPAFAHDRGTLVILTSHSGNTEETLSAFDEACKRRCQLVAITTGGKLHKAVTEAGLPAWVFTHHGQPRAAVGYSFGLLLALFTRLGLISDPSLDLKTALATLREAASSLGAEVAVKNNPAKRMAGQMIGRVVTVFASGFMAPVARRWKCQINELAKAAANFEVLPEADHNTVAGVCHPEDALSREIRVFLLANTDHVRNQKRVEGTRQVMMVEGLNTDLVTARGETRLAQMWSTLLFGDYTAYYLAMAYDVDPTPIPPIDALKEYMQD